MPSIKQPQISLHTFPTYFSPGIHHLPSVTIPALTSPSLPLLSAALRHLLATTSTSHCAQAMRHMFSKHPSNNHDGSPQS